MTEDKQLIHVPDVDPLTKSRALVAFVRSVDEAYGVSATIDAAKAKVKARAEAKLRVGMERGKKALLNAMRGMERMREEIRSERPQVVTSVDNAFIGIGGLDVATADFVVPPNACAQIVVPLKRSPFFGPMGVRVSTTYASDPGFKAILDIQDVEVGCLSILDGTILSDSWEAPPGSAVKVGWPVFASHCFAESLMLSVKNTYSYAVRFLLNIYGDKLLAWPVGYASGDVYNPKATRGQHEVHRHRHRNYGA